MFRRLPEDNRDIVTIMFEGEPLEVPEGETVAAAMSIAGRGATRTTPVSGAPRQAYCLMGVCFECLMVIDGQSDQQACMVTVRDGMTVQRQEGAGKVASNGAGS